MTEKNLLFAKRKKISLALPIKLYMRIIEEQDKITRETGITPKIPEIIYKRLKEAYDLDR